MALNQTTDLELQDSPGKDLPKDIVVGDQTLRHSLDVQEYEEQPKNYDPKYVPNKIFDDTLLALITTDCGPLAVSGWLCHWSAGSALSGKDTIILNALLLC